MAYKQTPVSRWAEMDNAELLEAFDIVCTTICNAQNFTRGASAAMLIDRENCKNEILRRMKEA